jgi:hypothetical protein
MKQIFIILFFNLFLITLLHSQSKNNITLIDYYNWSSHTTFKMCNSPKTTGYGKLSDSISNTMNGIIFYHINNKYYPIQSWADYYYWFTQKYTSLFSCPELYEYYYFTENNYGMVTYIFGEHNLYKNYPSNIFIRFDDKPNNKYKPKFNEKKLHNNVENYKENENYHNSNMKFNNTKEHKIIRNSSFKKNRNIK